MARRLHFE